MQYKKLDVKLIIKNEKEVLIPRVNYTLITNLMH